MAMRGDVWVSMRADMFPSRLCREYDRFAGSCQHFFFDNSKKSFVSGKSRRKTALIGKKRAQSSLIGTVTGFSEFGRQ